jgi:hypothetical protein
MNPSFSRVGRASFAYRIARHTAVLAALLLDASCRSPSVQIFRGDLWEWSGTQWTRMPASGGPSPRASTAMAYDSTRKVTVLFGGQNDDGIFGDTWEWDGARWNQRTPPVSPPPRFQHFMVFDASRQKTVLFGGVQESCTAASPCAALWTWDGSTWTPDTGSPPVPEVNGPMVFDTKRQVVVMVAGAMNNTVLTVWEWNGSTWTQPMPATTPPATAGLACLGAAYDPLRGVTVVAEAFWNAEGGELSQTWEWDGSTWTAAQAPFSFSFDFFPAVFDSAMGQVLLLEESGALSWTGVAWNAQGASNDDIGLYDYAVAYDAGRNRPLLFGGRIHYEPE